RRQRFRLLELVPQPQFRLAPAAPFDVCTLTIGEWFGEPVGREAVFCRGERLLQVSSVVHNISPRARSRLAALASFRLALTMYAFAPLVFSSRSSRVIASSDISFP